MVGIRTSTKTPNKRGTTAKKKVAVVSVAEAEEAARLADLPLEATVALAEVAGAIKDGLLAFASATGFVVTNVRFPVDLKGRPAPLSQTVRDAASQVRFESAPCIGRALSPGLNGEPN
jgi:hypothetical protein